MMTVPPVWVTLPSWVLPWFSSPTVSEPPLMVTVPTPSPEETFREPASMVPPERVSLPVVPASRPRLMAFSTRSTPVPVTVRVPVRPLSAPRLSEPRSGCVPLPTMAVSSGE